MSAGSGLYTGAGGGGIGQIGIDATPNGTGRAGGNGLTTWSSWLTAITPQMSGVSGWSTATSGGYIAAGGAGCSDVGYPQTSGGLGGGGRGRARSGSTDTIPMRGIANTGSGGGGNGWGNPSGSSGGGGSGIVIFRYPKLLVGG